MALSMTEDIKMRFRHGSPIIRLIMVNVAIHVALLLIFVPFYLILQVPSVDFDGFMREWFWFPSQWIQIPFRLWTMFTYMFLHADAWHLLSNMLILYIFGIRLNDLLSSEKIFPIYFWGGIAGALFFSLCFNIFPVFDNYQDAGHILGASASVMAVVFATATLSPTGTFHIPFINVNIELRYIAVGWVILNIIGTLNNNPGGAFAHLGGAFMGWFFIQQLRRGKDMAVPVNRVIDFFQFKQKNTHNYNKNKAAKRKKAKKGEQPSFKATMKVYKGSARSDYYGNEYGRSFIQKYSDMSREECLNAILEKIKRSGYDGLSEDEKVFLDRYK
jgi:membrane associated rhomboid family serine protease